MTQEANIKPEQTAEAPPARKIGYVSTRLESEKQTSVQTPQTPAFVITDWASI